MRSHLVSRFPALQKVPYIELCSSTTAVERLPRFSDTFGCDTWVKRDDVTSPIYGGNKTRKLEWLLGKAVALGARTLVTTGAAGSHHVIATAIHGRALGLTTHAVYVAQPNSAHVEENLGIALALGVEPHVAAHAYLVPANAAVVEAKLQLLGLHPFMIGPGGSTPLGCFGYVEGGLEIAAQIGSRQLPEPKEILVALGSGGTAAGLAIALALSGMTTRLVVVRVVNQWLSPRFWFERLVRTTVQTLRTHDNTFPDIADAALERVVHDDSQLGLGYGISTHESDAAVREAEQDGLHLETTYTGKCFAALVDRARQEKMPRLIVNTLNSRSVDIEAREIPQNLRCLLR